MFIETIAASFSRRGTRINSPQRDSTGNSYRTITVAPGAARCVGFTRSSYYSSAYAVILFVTVFGLASIYVKALNKVKER